MDMIATTFDIAILRSQAVLMTTAPPPRTGSRRYDNLPQNTCDGICSRQTARSMPCRRSTRRLNEGLRTLNRQRSIQGLKKVDLRWATLGQQHVQNRSASGCGAARYETRDTGACPRSRL